MIEIIIYEYLKENLSVPAYIQKPKEKTQKPIDKFYKSNYAISVLVHLIHSCKKEELNWQ